MPTDDAAPNLSLVPTDGSFDLERLFEHAPMGLASLSGDGVLTGANLAFASVLACKRDVLVDAKLHDLLDPGMGRDIIDGVIAEAIAGHSRAVDVDLCAPTPRAHTKHCSLRLWVFVSSSFRF